MPERLRLRARATCPPSPQPRRDIDYLAKDYASFRRLMLDRLAAGAAAGASEPPPTWG